MPLTAILRRACIAALAACMLASCNPPAAVLGDADYAGLGLQQSCTADARDGAAGASDDMKTAGGLAFSVRTPRNYDRTRAHPLLVVYAPAGYVRQRAERYYALTTAATAAGMLVAYVDHAPMAMPSFTQLGQVPEVVARHWCIDSARVSFAGHSDGGSSAGAVAFLRTTSVRPRALVISAAGIRKQDLEAYSCPAPLSTLIVHSSADERFPPPAYGSGAAQWWAQCNRCSPPTRTPDAQGCVDYTGCVDDVRVRHCDPHTGHEQWPLDERDVLGFLRAAGAVGGPR